MRRIAACIAAGAMLSFASPAWGQGTYTTYTCRGPDNTPASIDGWTSQGVADRLNACPRGGDLTVGPAQHQFAAVEGAGWSFTAPANTRIAGFTLYRTVRMESRDGWAWNYSLLKNAIAGVPENYVETCWSAGGCFALGDGGVSPASSVGQSGLNTPSLHAWVDCNPGGCPAGSGTALIRLHRGDFVLRDLANPVFTTTPTGDLLDGTAPVSGVRSVSFQAGDRGGGLYEAALRVDDDTVATVKIDENGGRCRVPFTGAVPCKLSGSGTIDYDTAALPDGQHSIRLIVTDATGTNAAIHGPVRITTANQTMACEPNAAPELVARFATTRRSALTRRRGRALTLRGVLRGAAEGTPVVLVSREIRTGARPAVVSSAVTGPGGAFTIPVPAGRSRTLRVAYRPAPAAPRLRCSNRLRLRVPARVSFSARRTSARRFRLSGRLVGGAIPRRGKVVELQAFERGRWREFRTIRSRTSGRFATSYRFTSASTGRRFRLRVRVRPEPTYPYSVGYSRVARVRVR
jgi:hypothetical protein